MHTHRKDRKKRKMHIVKPFVSQADIWRRCRAIREEKLKEEYEPLSYEKVKAEYGFKKAGMLFVYKLSDYTNLSKRDRRTLPKDDFAIVNKYTDLFMTSAIKHTIFLNLMQVYIKPVIRTEFHPRDNTLGENCGRIENIQKTVLLEKTFQIFKKLKNFDKNTFNKIISDMIKIENGNLADLLLNDYLLLGSLLKNPTFLKTKIQPENTILQQISNQR